MGKSGRAAAALLAAALFILIEPGNRAWAQQVTLSARDADLTLSGTLLDFDGMFYRVETEHGALTIAAANVHCSGPGCPDLASFVPEFTIAAPGDFDSGLVAALIADFAAAAELELRASGADDGSVHFELHPSAPQSGATTELAGQSLTSAAAVMRITLTTYAGEEGLLALLSRQADLTLSLSELRDDEVHTRILALDAFIPVNNPANPVLRMTLPQLIGVMSGEIDNWAQLGGPDLPITLHALERNTAQQQGLEALLLGPGALEIGAQVARHASLPALRRGVDADDSAIALLPRSAATSVSPIALQGACGFSLPASPIAIKAEDFPLSTPVLLNTRLERLPAPLSRFLDHLETARAAAVLRQFGFSDLAPEFEPAEAQGRRLSHAIIAAGNGVGLEELQHLTARMLPTARLSTTFRFETGTSGLDVSSRGNVIAFARDLAAGHYDGHEVVFAGFTDGDGSAAVNLTLSQNRAETVRDAVLQAAPGIESRDVTLTAEGFGEAMPLACDDSEQGRQVNRRVEIWLR